MYICIFIKVNSYTPLNWRLLGSLLMEVTFDGKATFSPTTQPTFSANIPANKTEREVTKLDGLKGLDVELGELKQKVKSKDGDKKVSNGTGDVDSFHLYKESIEVSMHAELMIEESPMLGEDIEQQQEEDHLMSTNVTKKLELVEFEETTWVKRNKLIAIRKLQCTFAHSISKYLFCFIKPLRLNFNPN